jgi:hypothetical protein
LPSTYLTDSGFIMTLTTPAARSAFCLMVAAINLPHILMDKDNGIETEPFEKLLTKQSAWLRGELKSQANLERFYEAFEEWRQARSEEDTLAWRISGLCCAALYSSIESLLDPECDDIKLICNYVDDLYDEMASLGADVDDLRQYWQEIQSEFNTEFSRTQHLPLSKRYFQWLGEMDTSLFGVSND